MSPAARHRALRAAAAVAALGACGPKAPLAPVVSDPADPLGTVAACQQQTRDAVVADTIDEALPCCRILDTFYSGDMSRFDEWDTRDACCEALDWQGSVACTPWGPPTPPEMSWA